ncbi:MAG: glycosyltransferase family 4 protein [Halothiobacillaceae bacterium]|nr:MAG: glycosyltransferase family 4 protein [Halothiobacillaceae bacterium]
MKVLHIEAGRHLYGGARQVLYLLEGLAARGVESILACPEGSDIAREARPWARVVEMRMGGELDLMLPGRLRRLMMDTRPDLVHVHSRRGVDVWGGIAARRAGIPALLSRRVDNPEPRWLAHWKYGLYAKVIAISEGIRQVLLREGIPPEHVVTVRSAVDAAPYLHACERDAFRETFGLPEHALALGVIAQLIPRKGHRHLLAILPEIVQRHPEVRVLFLGKGAHRPQLERQVEQLGLARHVQFTGFRDDLARWLPCLDIVVHPADMEGLGVSLLQASSASLPIIATRAGGIPEAVRDGENGLLIPPADPTALAEALLRLLDNAPLRTTMGATGRALVQREFSVTGMVQGNLALYRQILSAGTLA